MCIGANATGECCYGVYEMNRCYDVAAPFYLNTSTFAPDGEPFFCYPRTCVLFLLLSFLYPRPSPAIPPRLRLFCCVH